MTTMDINLLRSLVTVAALAAFLGVVWWAYGPARKERFERDAQLPFIEDEPSPHAPLPSGEGKVRREMTYRSFPNDRMGARR